jgi:RecA/RadA recombinase
MDREQALDTVLGQIERQFGKGAVMKMNDQAQVAIAAVSTGSLSLDVALGVGGLPRGRVVEVFGPESSGKTTLVYHVIAEAQRRGGICAFIDAEHAMDPAYAKRIGVNIDELLVSQPDTGEQALEICELLVRSGALAVVAIDSVAALTPKAEIEGEMGDSHVGLQARLMSQALRKLAGTLNKTDTICLFTNQLREKIGVMFGNPETTSGGRGRGDRQPRPRQGGQEQGGAAVQAGRVRHHLRRRHLVGRHCARHGAREEGRPEVGLVLLVRRRAARAGSPERDGVPQGAPRRRARDPACDPGAGGARAGDLGAAPAAGGGLERGDARAGRGRGRSHDRLTVAVTEAPDPIELAARALRHHDRSRRQIDERLERAGVDASARADALAALERVGYVDDGRFAAERAASLAARGYGDLAIAERLAADGVARDVAEAAIAVLEPECDRAATQLLRKGFAVDAVETAGCRFAEDGPEA